MQPALAPVFKGPNASTHLPAPSVLPTASISIRYVSTQADLAAVLSVGGNAIVIELQADITLLTLHVY